MTLHFTREEKEKENLFEYEKFMDYRTLKKLVGVLMLKVERQICRIRFLFEMVFSRSLFRKIVPTSPSPIPYPPMTNTTTEAILHHPPFPDCHSATLYFHSHPPYPPTPRFSLRCGVVFPSYSTLSCRVPPELYTPSISEDSSCCMESNNILPHTPPLFRRPPPRIAAFL